MTQIPEPARIEIEQMIDARAKVWGDAVIDHVIAMIEQERVNTVNYIDGRIIQPMNPARDPANTTGVTREDVLRWAVEHDITASELIAYRKARSIEADNGSADRTD